MRLIKRDIAKGRLSAEQSGGNVAMTTSSIFITTLDSY